MWLLSHTKRARLSAELGWICSIGRKLETAPRWTDSWHATRNPSAARDCLGPNNRSEPQVLQSCESSAVSAAPFLLRVARFGFGFFALRGAFGDAADRAARARRGLAAARPRSSAVVSTNWGTGSISCWSITGFPMSPSPAWTGIESSAMLPTSSSIASYRFIDLRQAIDCRSVRRQLRECRTLEHPQAAAAVAFDAHQLFALQRLEKVHQPAEVIAAFIETTFGLSQDLFHVTEIHRPAGIFRRRQDF